MSLKVTKDAGTRISRSKFRWRLGIGENRIRKPHTLRSGILPEHDKYHPAIPLIPPPSPFALRFPYHTHQQRFPKQKDLSVKFFSEYCHKPWLFRNFYETAHPLPFRGIDFKFWRSTKSLSSWMEKTERIGNRLAQARVPESKEFEFERGRDGRRKVQRVFELREIRWRARPFHGVPSGDLYFRGKLMAKGIRPLGAPAGRWCYSLPDDAQDYPHFYRPSFPRSKLFAQAESGTAVEGSETAESGKKEEERWNWGWWQASADKENKKKK
uniref:Uncharacterized protein n=1 Tax=Chromera velia CCMP2878 TaxID=1169474 RepID=A0A0G4GPC1_9ALVE|mmetsp:Transcript_53162/g.104073  ORF Transcript_53162/g.104073 Transcript_53162/m.104073 type:complete len:269 (+) Transcript_53162:211-1017(+)|eukprot:Cvel_4993.t1-p1 / transcript=Cvel_4993.t1 / gene=Cvel_4993 / organism=Chromera_velia_CCMP2878 / gene_product=hypothetical protein / transcript_product=hypothetical protein / location=Cvel_scaffold226:29765-34911(-) / protein_length=268 / sequence_SO=supercontig / SO=protein_coding / is_pseudo=false